MTWLITVARNHPIDRLRKRDQYATFDTEDVSQVASSWPTPEEAVLAASMRGTVRDCLAELKPPRADAICRAYRYGDSYADLASRYSVLVNTVRTWLRRSLIQLRACLNE